MTEYLKKIPVDLQDLIRACSGAADLHGYRIFLVGGFVRDLVLGIRNLDLDIVVTPDAVGFAQVLSKRLGAEAVLHKRFGTATLRMLGAPKIDFATARTEVYPEPASLPIVTFAGIEDDLRRRDFTINCMAISINKDDYGRLVDFYGGLDDIRAKKIRILHDLSFIDDPTRILRAIRFEQRYAFRIEPHTLRLLNTAVGLDMLKRVKHERLRDAFILNLKEEKALEQITRIRALTGFDFIHPGLKAGAAKLDLLRSVQKQVFWFHSMFQGRRLLDVWLIYFMALLDPLDKNALRQVLKGFSFRKGEEKRILSLRGAGIRRIRALEQKNIAPRQVFQMLDHLSYEAIIFIRAKYPDKNLQRHIAEFLSRHNLVRLCITGHDLAGLGAKPGPQYQRLLKKARDAKLDGVIHSRGEELFFVRQLLKNK